VSDHVIHVGDCLGPEGLVTLGDKSVDHVITDPPYDEHTHKAGRRGHTGYAEDHVSQRATFNRNRELGFDPLTVAHMYALAGHFARVARRWVVVFCALEMTHHWRRECEREGLQYIRTMLWHKLGATPQFTGDRPAQACEAMVLFHPPGRKRWNGGGKHGFYEFPIVLDRGGRTPRLHTTQKPLELMRALVADFTDPGDLVLDPFAGSGTTGVACRMLGRRFIGWEQNPDYAEIARRRIAGEEAKPRAEQPSLFGGVR